MQAASALRSLPVFSAKARKVRAVALLTSSMLSASSACAIGAGSRHRPHHVAAEPGEDGAAHALGVLKRQERGDARAHRIAHHIGPGDAQMIEQAARVLGHQRRAVGRRIVELVALAMPAIVDGDDAKAILGQKTDPAGVDPIVLDTGGKTVDQQNGIAARLRP